VGWDEIEINTADVRAVDELLQDASRASGEVERKNEDEAVSRRNQQVALDENITALIQRILTKQALLAAGHPGSIPTLAADALFTKTGQRRTRLGKPSQLHLLRFLETLLDDALEREQEDEE
jgi:hypothetical protein